MDLKSMMGLTDLMDLKGLMCRMKAILMLIVMRRVTQRRDRKERSDIRRGPDIRRLVVETDTIILV